MGGDVHRLTSFCCNDWKLSLSKRPHIGPVALRPTAHPSPVLLEIQNLVVLLLTRSRIVLVFVTNPQGAEDSEFPLVKMIV